jgi:catechol-2,3-dioxygenase
MAGIESINHTAFCVHDVVAAMDFYCNVLGAKPHQRSNFQIEDARAGVAIFQSLILEDYLFALTVPSNYMPMPPTDQLRGAHGFRHGFTIARRRFDEVMDSLRKHDIAFEGPIDHPEKGPFGQSIYFKDPSGNFLEILWRRDEDPNSKKRRYVSVE